MTWEHQVTYNKYQKISFLCSLSRKFVQMLSVVLFATCGTSVFAVTPIPDNATLRVAVEACLTEAPGNGLCSGYGSTSGYGEMPDWDTSNITDMKGLFSNNTAYNVRAYADLMYTFNADVSGWDTSSVVTMEGMFKDTSAFNKDITGWDTSKVTTMKEMFRSAAAFRQDIRVWNVISVTDFFLMFSGTTKMVNYLSAPTPTPTVAYFTGTIVPAAPTITAISPSSGATGGGTSVVITGTNFTGATAVSFGSTAASSYTVDSATQITATAPAGSAGSVNVAVTTAGGTATSTGAYSYVSAPSSDATLSSILFSQGALSPAFSSGTASYTASVSNAVSSLTVTPTVTEGTATITVNGVAVTSGAASSAISLNAGANTITTIVTAGDGTTTQTYTIIVTRAAASQSVTVTNPGAPTIGTATPGNAQVSVAFTAPANTGGAAITNYEYSTDGGTSWTAFNPATTVSPVMISGLINGNSYSIALRAVNSAGDGAASETITVLLGLPQNEFDKRADNIRQLITQDATRSLGSTLQANRRMTNDARERFVISQQVSEDDVSRNNVAFDLDGTAQVSGTTLSTRGRFFEQTGNAAGTPRRLVFGDFDLQHDGETNSTTATVTVRMAWEHMYGDKTMLGYFGGGELAHSNIKGSFEGGQERLGLSFGGYAVHQLDERMFLDGFITLGAGRNDLEMANEVLALDTDYTTRTATIGAAASGVYEYGDYEFRPDLAFSYGKTWIGNVGFTGRAYGLVDDSLTLNAGSVSIGNLTLRPEMIWALDASTVAESRSQLSFAPRAICERSMSTTRTEHCGGGAELGLSSQSEDGLSAAEFRIIMDRVGSSNRSSFALTLEHRF